MSLPKCSKQCVLDVLSEAKSVYGCKNSADFSCLCAKFGFGAAISESARNSGCDEYGENATNYFALWFCASGATTWATTTTTPRVEETEPAWKVWLRRQDAISGGSFASVMATSTTASTTPTNQPSMPPQTITLIQTPTQSAIYTSSGNGASAGAIAGGVVGGIAGLALIVGAVILFLKRRKSREGMAAREMQVDTGEEKAGEMEMQVESMGRK